MTGSSITVLSNLAYLIGAVVVAIIAGVGVWLHHRQPKSADASMASFRKGLSALAPDPPSGRSSGPVRPRAAVTGLTHVRVDARTTDVDAVAAEAAGDWVDGEPG